MTLRHTLGALALGLALCDACAEYPDRLLRLVVPFPAGGAPDIIARAVAERLGKRIDQPVLVDNRPGAGGRLGAESVAKAAPDGYTLILATASAHSVAAATGNTLTYEPVRGFAAVSMLAQSPGALLVRADAPWRGYADMAAQAKAQPGRLNFGSPGSGTGFHLTGEMLRIMAGIDIVHVPYKGAAPAIADLIGGQVQILFDSSAKPHIDAGRLRALATTGLKRWFLLPEVPTLDELGLKGFQAIAWQGVMVPAGTPGVVVQKLGAAIAAALDDAALRASLAGLGYEVYGGGAGPMADFVAADTARWRRVVLERGLKLD